MITDPSSSPYGPPPPAPVPAGIFGLGGRALGRAALAGLVAEVGFVVLVAVVAVAARVLLGTCQGDSCMGGPAFYLSVLASPFAAFAALAAALVTFRVPRAWGVAGVAIVVALTLLVAAAAGVLGYVQAAGPVVAVVVGLLAAGFGPVSAVAATAMVNGRGVLRFVPVPAVVVLVVLAVVLGQLLAPGRQASRITAAVPQPYAYDAPGALLYSLILNRSTNVLELDYSGDEFVSVHEVGPVPAAARAAACSPALPVGEPTGLCRRLPGPSADVTVWRTEAGVSGADEAYIVVARPDVTIVLFATTMADDAAALALVARLRPVGAATLLDAAENVYV